MNWGAQALHVARKDLRYAGWKLVAYVLIVAAATTAAAGSATISLSLPGSLLVVAAGLLLAVVLIQADHPGAVDAFWATRPLRPGAMVAAKLLVVGLVLIGVPLVGQAVALSLYDISPAEMASHLLATLTWLAQGLLLAAAIGALTPDLKSAMLALVVVLAALVFLPVLAAHLLGMPSGGSAPLWAALLFSVAWIAIIADQFGSRRVKRGRLLAIVLGVFALLVPWPPRATPLSEAPQGVSPQLRPDVLELWGIRMETPREATVRLRIGGLDPGHTYVLDAPVVELFPPDAAARVEFSLERQWMALPGAGPALPLGDTIFLINAGTRPIATSGTRDAAWMVPVSARQAALIGDPGTRVALRGRLVILAPTVAARLPFREGASATTPGARLRIESVGWNADDVLATLRRSTLRSGDVRARSGLLSHLPFTGAPAFLLVNPGRREGMVLDRRGATGSSAGLVVPGPGTWTEEIDLRSPVHLGPGAPEPALPSREWLEGAELLVLEWEPIGSEPIRLEQAPGD